jgi:predicted MFS family arabinose efflux permease
MAKCAASRATEVNFDFLGCITGVSGLILINFALNQAPLVGWDTPYVGYLLIIGLLLVFGFVCVELHETTTNPILPIRGLQPQAILALGCIAAGWASHGIWIYYLYLFQTNIRHLTPTLATVRLIPVAPIGVLFALSTNFLIKKLHVSRVMLLSMIFFLAGILLLAFAPADQSYWLQTFCSVIITPGGMNLSFPAATILLSNSMPREYQGKAASLVSTVLNYSIASGLGFAGSIQRRVNADGPHILEGYRCAWYLGIGFNVLGLLISTYFIWSLRNRR